MYNHNICYLFQHTEFFPATATDILGTVTVLGTVTDTVDIVADILIGMFKPSVIQL